MAKHCMHQSLYRFLCISRQQLFHLEWHWMQIGLQQMQPKWQILKQQHTPFSWTRIMNGRILGRVCRWRMQPSSHIITMCWKICRIVPLQTRISIQQLTRNPATAQPTRPTTPSPTAEVRLQYRSSGMMKMEIWLPICMMKMEIWS